MHSRIFEEQADKNQVAKAKDGLRRQQQEQKAVKRPEAAGWLAAVAAATRRAECIIARCSASSAGKGQLPNFQYVTVMHGSDLLVLAHMQVRLSARTSNDPYYELRQSPRAMLLAVLGPPGVARVACVVLRAAISTAHAKERARAQGRRSPSAVRRLHANQRATLLRGPLLQGWRMRYQDKQQTSSRPCVFNETFGCTLLVNGEIKVWVSSRCRARIRCDLSTVIQCGSFWWSSSSCMCPHKDPHEDRAAAKNRTLTSVDPLRFEYSWASHGLATAKPQVQGNTGALPPPFQQHVCKLEKHTSPGPCILNQTFGCTRHESGEIHVWVTKRCRGLIRCDESTAVQCGDWRRPTS
eukprot:6202802-Pleurochrysis_carterae.AAC.1